MSTAEISFNDHAPRNVAAPTPTRREGKEVVPSIKLGDDGVSESKVSIPRDIINALAKDIQQFKEISFSDPTPGKVAKVAALAWAWREGKDIVPSIKRQFGYVISSKSYAQDLRKEVQNLMDETERVNNAVEEAKNNSRNVYSHVTDWQASAEKALKEARDLLGDFEEVSKTDCYGTLPSLSFRSQFRRKAKEKIEDIQKLGLEGGEFKELYDIFSAPGSGNVVAPDLARRDGKDAVQSTTATGSVFPASTSIKLRNNEVFESRALMIRDIMDALANNSNSVVGVHGMGGIGKSTLLVDVERKVRDEKSFHWVAKANVSENPDIKTIQGEIADALGLTEIKNKETISGRAKLLHDRLKDEEREKKKVLIILDNLWEGLDLKKVGIPCGHDNEVIGCKLLLTSRDCNVLQREMVCDRDFRLDGLAEDEARSLFERLVGDKFHDDKFKPLVDEALHVCAGFPFLIVNMAKHFKHAGLSEWKNVLKQIKLFPNKGISKVINTMLQISYNYLNDWEKSLLALCVAYGTSKPSLENLVRYGVGWGLFREDNMEEARESLKLGICSLQATSLLLEDGDADGFKIHDLVHQFVATVASRDHPLLILKDKDMLITELPKDKLKSCRAVCFSYVDMKELPEELYCPELHIFLVFTNNESLEVPNSYFNSMKKLMVLNLTGIHLICSPSCSFQFLENLRTLCLDSCSIDNVAIFGELRGVQILSFANSNIHRLPKEIGQMVELRLLDLNNCLQLHIIEPGVLGSLIKLEELFMENSFDQWNVAEQAPPINASLIELNKMKNLCTLYVCIPDLTMLPEDLNIKKLTKYRIQIGGRSCSSHKGSRTLELKLNPIRDILRKGCIQMALDRIDDLYLDELNEIEQSICKLFPEGFPNLKHLHVKNSHSIYYIFRQVVFPNLETLDITGMGNIKMIWDNQVYFKHLKTLDVSHCDRLTNMFTPIIARNLVELTKLKISNCKMLIQVISDEGGDEGHVVAFKLLKYMELDGLMGLRCFNSGGYTLIFPLLEDVIVTRCLNMKFFSEGPIKAPKLKKVQVSRVAWFWKGNLNTTIQNMYEEMATIAEVKFMRLSKFPELIEKWHSKHIPIEPFSELESLVVDKCPSFINAIPSTLMLPLHNVRTLQVRDCELLKEIFDLEGLEGEKSTQVLPQLWHLSLVNLPKLRLLRNENIQGRLFFNSLSHLTLYKCSNLRYAFATSMIQCLATLEFMEIKECGQMEEVIAEEEGHESAVEEIIFPHLWWMELECLPNLTSFLSGKNHMLKCPDLRWLIISHCPRMRSFTRQSLMEIDHYTSSLFTPQVAFLGLETLYITALDAIEMIWDNQVVMDSFHHLKCLRVQNCDKLASLVPSCIIGRLLSLESLEARECGSLEIVFKLQPLNPLDGHLVDCFPLKKLELFGLSELKCVWDKELYRQVRFQHLCSVSVSKCESLTSLFPASIARDLMQLEELKIDKCGIMELIDNEGPIPRDVFPKLTSLKFKHLTELKCIYTGMHALHWPALKTLEVHECNKVEILASQLENEMPLHKWPLFLIEKGTFPNLQEMKLDLSKRMQICHGAFHDEEFFYRIRFLELHHLSKESAISTFCFVRSLSNLENLVVCESNLEGLTINVEAMEGSSSTLKVILPLSRYLKALDVSHCDGLSYLLTPIMVGNLMELTKLRISKCEILIKVISDEGGQEGHVEDFNQLKYMEHDGLTELRCFIQKEGQGSTVEAIRFPKLRLIELECLPALTSFLSGKNQRLECPVLEEVTITHCPKMTRIGTLIPRCPPCISRALNRFSLCPLPTAPR